MIQNYVYIFEIYFLICQSYQVGKDTISYKLKDVHTDPLTASRLARWHAHGVIMALLSLVPGIVLIWLKFGASYVYLPAIGAGLIRLALYDISFNKWADLDLSYLGSTPKADRFFIQLFGTNGALKKALIFFILLILFQWPFMKLLIKL